MKCTILHETRGRMRVRTMQGAMSLRQADILEAYLRQIQGITKATVYDRTGDAVICYDAPRTAIIQALASFSYANEQALAPEHSSRAMSREFDCIAVLARYEAAVHPELCAHADHGRALRAVYQGRA